MKLIKTHLYRKLFLLPAITLLFVGLFTYHSETTFGLTLINPQISITSNADVGGTLSKASGTFVIDHPLDPVNKLLYHSFVESPDPKNIYDGIAKLDRNGEATITLPAYFETLNIDYRYQYTALGTAMPGLYIKNAIQNNEFTISGGVPGGSVAWQVTGNRNDPFIQNNPIINEVEKGPDQPVDKGEFLFEGYRDQYDD